MKKQETETKTENLGPKRVREALHTKSNHRGRGRTPAERREAYVRYRANKKRAIDLETRNFQHLVLYPASDFGVDKEHQFYNMGGNSAIIYCYEIGPRIRRRPKLRHDMDNGNNEEKFRDGICSVSNLEKLTEKLAEIGIKRMPSEGDYSEIVIFKLPREYTKSELKEMLKIEQKRLDELNQLLYPEVLYPDVHKLILELKRFVPPKVKKMETGYREIIGLPMVKSLLELMCIYSQLTHGDVEEYDGAREMLLVLTNNG